MEHHHRTCRGTVLAVIITLAAALAAPPAAQWPVPACQVTVSLENQLRRVTGTVMEECPGIHSAPWGNWGVESDYDSRKDKDQFRGWKPQGLEASMEPGMKRTGVVLHMGR